MVRDAAEEAGRRRMPRVRNVVFTLNGYVLEDERRLLEEPAFRYCVFGRETGDRGNEHLQGYAEFEEQKEWAAAKETVSVRSHIERRRGSQKQAIDYCKKEGNWSESGVPRSQGQRVDLEEISGLIQDGMTDLEVAHYDFSRWVQYGKRFNTFRDLLCEPRTLESPAPDVRLYWGATGTGKSLAAREEFPNICVHFDENWFDGYEPMVHDEYLFDDFDWSTMKINKLLQVLDRYAIRVPVKHGSKIWKPKVIILTSNHPLEEWYPFAKQSARDALKRRFGDNIRHFE